MINTRAGRARMSPAPGRPQRRKASSKSTSKEIDAAYEEDGEDESLFQEPAEAFEEFAWEGEDPEEEWEDFLDEAEEESEVLFEEEAPPQLKPKIPIGSEPAGKTIYVKIPLGQYSYCLDYDKKAKKCRKSETRNIKPTTGIYIPSGYSPQAKVDIVLYLHGHKGDIPGFDATIDQYWNGNKYKSLGLREKVLQSGKNVILIAPTLGMKSEPDRLVSGKGLDDYLDKVMEALTMYYDPYKGK
jgi:hypothetical protein